MSQLTLREFIPGAAPSFALANARFERPCSSDLQRFKHDARLAWRSRTLLRLLRAFPGSSIRQLQERYAETESLGRKALYYVLVEMENRGQVRLELRSLGRQGRMHFVYPVTTEER